MEQTRYVGGGSGGYTIDRDAVLRRGTQDALMRPLLVVVALFVLQLPLRRAAEGALEVTGVLATAEVPARLSLLVDNGMVAAYLLLAWRVVTHLKAVGASSRSLTLARRGRALVTVGAVADLVQNVLLWSHVAGRAPARGLMSGAPDEFLLVWSRVVFVLVVAGGLLLVAAFVLDRRAARGAVSRSQTARTDPGGTIICCSGGGIRSAAFSMGGLRALVTAGVYPRARAVIGVSGGGYTAAAFHVLRWSPSPRGASGATEFPHPWGDPILGPDSEADALFALGSPETGWIRRHTRYLLGAFGVAVQGVLSFLLGVAVNFLLIAAVVTSAAWILAWTFLASGRLVPGAPDAEGLEYAGTAVAAFSAGPVLPGWAFLDLAWVPLAAGVAAFGVRKLWERWATPPQPLRLVTESCAAVLVPVGLLLALLLLGVPPLLAWLAEPAGASPEAIAQSSQGWLGTLRSFVVPSQVSAGQAVGTGGGLLAAILAVLASAKAAAPEAVEGFWAKLWARIKDPVVPWLAAVAAVGLVAALLLRTVAVLVADPARLGRWGVALGLVAGLVLVRTLTDANRTSLHHFFRWRISQAFLLRRSEGGVGPPPYGRPLRYSDAAPRDGGPALVTCAVANVSDDDVVPSGRDCVPFVFDHDVIGLTDRVLPDEALVPSAAYELDADPRFRDATIPAALAMSAAAFSPLAGRENAIVGPYRSVLALANARLGVWLPNPLYVDVADRVRQLLHRGDLAGASRALVQMARRTPLLAPGSARLAQGSDSRLDGAAAEEAAVAFVAALGLSVSAGEWFRRLLDRETLLVQARHAHASAVAELQRAGADRWQEPGARGLDRLAAARSMEQDAATGVDRALHDRTSLDHEAALDASSAVQPGFVDVAARSRWASAGFVKPGVSRVQKEALGKASIYDRYLYITDGGHYDNLGLVEALRRRPDRVIVLDASNDPENTFAALARAIATARMDLDCTVEMHLEPITRGEDAERAEAAWCHGTFGYADGVGGGEIFLAKAIKVSGLPHDIEAYGLAHADFPRTSTTDQSFDEFDFEAYRALGQYAVERLVAMPEFEA